MIAGGETPNFVIRHLLSGNFLASRASIMAAMRNRVIVIVLLACAAVACVAIGTRSSAQSRPASLPATKPRAEFLVRDATRATAPAPYPSAELVAACQAEAKNLEAKLDKTFRVVQSPPFVVAGNLDQLTLERYLQGTVVQPAQRLWQCYFRRKPDKVITVLLFDDDKSYRLWAKKLFNDTEVSHFGYYRDYDRTLVMNIGTGGGTLVHELTHALIVYDFPDVPTWFNEGLASLHEQCYYEKDRIVGLPNWRLPDLQEALRKGTLRPFAAMMADEDFYGERRGLNYAQARYLMLYLQEKGVLKDFYVYFREHHKGDNAGVEALEHVLGKKIDAIEDAWRKWIPTLRFP